MPSNATKVTARIELKSGSDSAFYQLFIDDAPTAYMSGITDLRTLHFVLKGAALSAVISLEYI